MLSEAQWEQVDRIAEALGVKPEARKKWRQRRRVASQWVPAILVEARKRHINLRPEDFPLPADQPRNGKAA